MHEVHRKITTALGHYETLVANHRTWTTPAGRTYSQEEAELIERAEAAIKYMQNNINDARQMASDVAGSFE